MGQNRIIPDLLLSRERIDLTSKNYFSMLRNISLTTFLLIILFDVMLMSYFDISLIVQGINLVILGLVGLSLLKLLKKTSSTSIKGDTLILKNSSNMPCVTSVNSIKRIKTVSVLFIQITYLYYNLDGKNRKTYIFTRKNAYSFTPEYLLKKAIELSKKQKANHKPGSVAV